MPDALLEKIASKKGHLHLVFKCPRSEMDITRRFGRRNAGSNPAEGTR